ncbi:hypothetical protein N1851_024513 [Merluccius polli]|uniref:Uncharacterized protein n=1 Tax=Merluccius polli TaxID=89951 RepID=A0AA47MES1_MERPO|nr:hypothetical protein N1851_024513 [Merluccius polli]
MDQALVFWQQAASCDCEENVVKDDSRVNRATDLWKKKAALNEAPQEFNLPEHSLITVSNKMVFKAKDDWVGVGAEQGLVSGHITWSPLGRTQVLESINNALHPLPEFTDALSGEVYVSASYLKPVLYLLTTLTLAENDVDTDLTKSIKSKPLGYMVEKYRDPAPELLDITFFLDSR